VCAIHAPITQPHGTAHSNVKTAGKEAGIMARDGRHEVEPGALAPASPAPRCCRGRLRRQRKHPSRAFPSKSNHVQVQPNSIDGEEAGREVRGGSSHKFKYGVLKYLQVLRTWYVLEYMYKYSK